MSLSAILILKANKKELDEEQEEFTEWNYMREI
jgi:hypothetical protein